MSKWKERILGIVISVILVAVFAVFMVILLQKARWCRRNC